MNYQANGKQLKGFASMSPERRKEIAAMGGRASRKGPVLSEAKYTFVEDPADFRQGFNRPTILDRIKRLFK